MIFYDIETKPRFDLLEKFTKPYPAFDVTSVKYGNTKDPAKRAELLALKEAEHIAGEAEYYRQAREKAALNPHTAQVIAIGLLKDCEFFCIHSEDEAALLETFWDTFDENQSAARPFVNWSGNGKREENFDLNMLLVRSWVNNVNPSARVFSGSHDNYISSRFTDASMRYLLSKREAYCSLSRAADELRLFDDSDSIKEKSTGDIVTGANFWRWFEGAMTKEEVEAKGFTFGDGIEWQRKLALSYLENDVRLLAAICNRIY